MSNLIKDNILDSFKGISVNTLAKSYDKLNQKKDINFMLFLKMNHEKKKHERNTYLKIYNRCVDKINIGIRQNQIHLYFQIPKYVNECNTYSPSKCINYINQNLKKYKFDTQILDEITILISWKNMEKNMDKNIK